MLSLNVPLGNVMIFGRWASESSCKEYLRRGEVAMMSVRKDVPRAAGGKANRVGGRVNWSWGLPA